MIRREDMFLPLQAVLQPPVRWLVAVEEAYRLGQYVNPPWKRALIFHRCQVEASAGEESAHTATLDESQQFFIREPHHITFKVL